MATLNIPLKSTTGRSRSGWNPDETEKV